MHAPGVSAQVAQPTAIVTGIVFDSIAGHPLSGAVVEFVSADNVGARPHTTVSDASGRYSLPDLPYGSYVAGFFHSPSDTLGLEGAPRRITIGTSRQRVDLARPSARRVIASICPTETRSDSTGALIGHVRDTESQVTIGGAAVAVEWSETVIDGQGVRERTRRMTTRAEEAGWFALCGLPSDAGLQARAFSGSDSSGYLDVDVPANGVRHISIFLGGATTVLVARDDTTGGGNTPEPALRGRARLSGTVVDRNGRPVAGAHALIWGTKLDATTNADGEFSLQGLPGGTHTLEVRVVGYTPTTRTVHLSESRPATVRIALGSPAQVLETVTVRGELLYSRNLLDFERRRRAGFGKFIMSEEIARRPHAKLSQLLQTVNGVRVESSPAGYRVTMRRNATYGMEGRGSCTPSLFVDGMLDRVRDFDAYFGQELAAIEVYAEEAGRPLEFLDASNPCGAIAIWTRPIAPKPKKP